MFYVEYFLLQKRNTLRKDYRDNLKYSKTAVDV